MLFKLIEDFDRDALIADMKRMGFNYNFDRFDDNQIPKLHQYCTDKYFQLKNKKPSETQKEVEKDIDFNNFEIDKDGYYIKDDVKFESPEAMEDYLKGLEEKLKKDE